MSFEVKVRTILEPKLGMSKRTYDGIKFNCPHCDKGNKYNLEVSTKDRIFHCWSCHYKGYISKLLYDFAVSDAWRNWDELKEKHTIIKKASKALELPINAIPFYRNKQVVEYLTKVRKIPYELLLERSVLYNFVDDTPYSNHIIFPFFDITGEELKGMCIQNFETKQYKNIGKRDYVPYIEFINPNWPVTISEGAYDVLSVINAIPCLGTSIPKAILEFCFDKDVIIAFDREVAESDKLQAAEDLSYHGARNILIFSNPYKDLNEFRQKNLDGLIEKYNTLFTELLQDEIPKQAA